MSDTNDLLAAELALGLLDDGERIAAERLRSTDDLFAAEVAKWDAIAEAWLRELPENATSAQFWEKITAIMVPSQLPLHRVSAAPEGPDRSPGVWRPLAIAASALACVFAGLWLSRAPALPLPPASHAPANTPGRFSVAQIGSVGAPHLAAVLYDRDAGTLTIRIAAIALDPAKAPELWLIKGTNPPHSLGFGQAGGATRMQASARLQRSLVGGATLAITLEPVSNHPHAAPSSKILGTGMISTL